MIVGPRYFGRSARFARVKKSKRKTRILEYMR